MTYTKETKQMETMKMHTLEDIHRMDEYEFENILVRTVESNARHDYYLDEIDTGQFVISYGEMPQMVFDSLDDAMEYYSRMIS
mgnify:CR=1 FL=1